jgi:hypothetical protein
MSRFSCGSQLSDDLDRDVGDAYYSLIFDESTTQNVKQLDMYIRYLSHQTKEIEIRYLDSVALGHAEAEKVLKAIVEVLEDHSLTLKHLLSLGRDGPNVNKAVLRKLNDNRKEKGIIPLIDLGPCLLHVVHNAFKYGLNVVGEVEDLIIDLYYWNKRSAARKEDFKSVQFEECVEQHVLTKHGKTRWLTRGPCAK